MKRAIFVLLAMLVLPAVAAAQTPMFREGTVTRMRMSNCLAVSHGWMAALSGARVDAVPEPCPEYTLVSDTVVYVIVGKNSRHLIPLAEKIRFRLHRNEVSVRVDDDNRESSYVVREMILRADWDRKRTAEPEVSSKPHIGRTLPRPEVAEASH